MTKCGKGCMPECEYFTTGGCISPFNCQYKIETGYINSATSIPTYIPTYMEKQMSMTAEEIEHCLERFTMGKTTDVMNFDYAGTLAYIQQLKSKNAALRERLEKAVELPSKDRVWYITEDEEGQESYIMSKPVSFLTVEELKYEMGKKYLSTREAAEARLAELKGENNG